MIRKQSIIFLGSDLFSSSLDMLISREDVSVRAVFGGVEPGHDEIHRLARTARIPYITSLFDPVRHRRFVREADILLSAAYSWKIPDSGIPYALNLHPTLLPVGRGARSIPWILFDMPRGGGVTLHAMTSRFDAGPIVAQRAIDGADELTFEAYILLCNQYGADLVAKFVDSPSAQLSAATPQLSLEPLLPAFPEERRVLDPRRPGAEAVRTIRKLGPFGALLKLDDQTFEVRGGEFLAKVDDVSAGAYQKNSLYSSLKTADGYLIFKPFDLSPVRTRGRAAAATRPGNAS